MANCNTAARPRQVHTEAAQIGILLVGSGILFFRCWQELGHQGIHTLAEVRAAAINATKSAAHPEGEDRVSMLHGSEDQKYYFLYLVLGYPVLGVWYWCSDQTIVQRVLGAKGLADAQLGPVFAGFIKILPVPLFVFPGVAASIRAQQIGGSGGSLETPWASS
jgi:SSS family solute:Na+ symporter